MMDKIIQYLKDCFKPPHIEKALSDREMIAMRNLVIAANERIWLSSNYPRRPEPHVDYEEELTIEREQILYDSIKTVKEVMTRRNHE